MENLKLVEISFWYKDYSYRIVENPDDVIKGCENYFKKVSSRYYKELLGQLDEIIKDFSNTTTEKHWLFAMNVYVLTKVGMIPNDQFNGLQYVYENKNGFCFI